MVERGTENPCEAVRYRPGPLCFLGRADMHRPFKPRDAGSLAELGVANVASPGCLRPHGEYLAVLAQLEEQRSFKP